MPQKEFHVQTEAGPLPCLLVEPDQGNLAADPALLLCFSSIRSQSINEEPYNAAAKLFVEAGHRALSFDLPNHGDRAGSRVATGLNGMREALLAGDDPFARFVSDGKAVVGHACASGLARNGNVYAYGVSRGGYCAIRLAAAESRIAAVAAIAPICDWRALTEFAAVSDRPEVASLALDRFADGFAGRALYVVIGNHDQRVGTRHCTRFMHRVFESESSSDLRESRHCFKVVTEAEAHAVDPRYYREGGEYLLASHQPPRAGL